MDFNQNIIGVDLGGTKVKSALIQGNEIVKTAQFLVSAHTTNPNIVVDEVIKAIRQVWSPTVTGIGIGVPSVVDPVTGMVYDVQNIPSWKIVPLKSILEEHFGLPVWINNDANCFALGEKYFGKGKSVQNMVGLIIGTGFAAGLIIAGKLFNGKHCGAGEFGMLPYLNHNFEYYCSGQFFQHFYQSDGLSMAQRANKQDPFALEAFSTLGHHLGKAITTILYALDPDLIVLGGSISKAYPHFKENLWKECQQFAYQATINDLKIEVSTNENVSVLGAASLCLDTPN